MNSKYVMIAGSVVTGLLGLTTSFFPDEVLHNLGIAQTRSITLLVQVTGALYMGFAIMNWMAKTILIGGIYARPLAMGNLAHFMIASMALVKAGISNPVSPYFWILVIVYSMLAASFAMVLFTTPVKKAG